VARVLVDNVSKLFGKLRVVDDVALEIQDHEFLVLVGPSGCGKTTTLRMIAGLEEVSEGSIFIGDRRVNDLPPQDRDVAMVFQNYALYPHMRVFDNLAFPLRMRRTPRAQVERRVSEVAAMLGLSELLKRYPRELSGGQRQRVALGRAIVRSPQVFLMDEPLSNLDALLRVQTRAELKRLHAQLQVTTVYVTHDQVEAMTMGDRLVVMNGGKVQQVGHPTEIYDHPANVFVATFIGSPAMNMLDGVLDRTADGAVLRARGVQVALDGEFVRRLGAVSGAVRFGVRPEDIEVVPATDGAVLVAGVDLVEPLGAETLVHMTLGEERLVARVASSRSPQPGDKVGVSFALPRCHVFAGESEAAVA
jgi:multiple sugar transport system ATP-binding protein